MLLAGEVSPRLLEDVLADLAARGAIVSVKGPSGEDLLTPAVAAAADVLAGRAPDRRAPASGKAAKNATATKSSGAYTPSDTIAREIAAIARGAEVSVRPPPAVAEPPAFESFTLSEPPPPAVAEDPADAAPSSLEDALIREVSERSPGHPRASDPAPLIEPSELRPRSSNPPPDPEPTIETRLEGAPEIPREPLKPQITLEELNAMTDIDAPIELNKPRELSMPLRRELSMPVFAKPAAVIAPHEPSKEPEPRPPAKLRPPPAREDEPRTPLSSVAAAPEKKKKKKKSSGGWAVFLGGLAVVGASVGMVLSWSRGTVAPKAGAPAATSPVPAQPRSVASATPAPSKPALPAGVRMEKLPDPLPDGVTLAKDQGYLEVHGPDNVPVWVNGEARSKGPTVRLALPRASYEVQVGPAAEKSQPKLVPVQPDQATIVDFGAGK